VEWVEGSSVECSLVPRPKQELCKRAWCHFTTYAESTVLIFCCSSVPRLSVVTAWQELST